MARRQSPPATPPPERAPDRRGALAKIRLFTGFGADELDRLAKIAREKRMRRGEMLMRAGDAGLCMMIVMTGEARVVLAGESGQEHVINTLGPGAVFGEIALFDGQPRTADVIASTNGKVLVIERAAVLRLLARDPSFAQSVISGLCAVLRGTIGQLEAMVFQDVATRLALCLLRLAQGPTPRHLDLTQAQLGQLVGASREIVNKRLRTLAAAGVVHLSPGRIVLLHEPSLAAMLPNARGFGL